MVPEEIGKDPHTIALQVVRHLFFDNAGKATLCGLFSGKMKIEIEKKSKF